MNIWETLPQPFLVLAPMEGVTDVVFRAVVRETGAPDLFFTEFTNVSSFASDKGHANALERLDRWEGDNPIIAQIWGKTPEHFAETARELANLGFDGLDINMGCPDKHVNKAGGGAAMIKTPELAVECIKCAKENTTLPVSVKTRLGFTYIDEWHDWLKLLLEQDLAALTVHLRTRKEMSKVPAHYELIPEIVKLRNEITPQTRLIINGDIKNRAHALELWHKYPGIDGFMLGRAVFEDIRCFSQQGDLRSSSKSSSVDRVRPTGSTRAKSARNDGPDERVKEELLRLLLRHLDLFDKRAAELAARGSYYPYDPLKHFFKIYIKDFPGAKELRTQLMNCKSTAELRKELRKKLAEK